MYRVGSSHVVDIGVSQFLDQLEDTLEKLSTVLCDGKLIDRHSELSSEVIAFHLLWHAQNLLGAHHDKFAIIRMMLNLVDIFHAATPAQQSRFKPQK